MSITAVQFIGQSEPEAIFRRSETMYRVELRLRGAAPCSPAAHTIDVQSYDAHAAMAKVEQIMTDDDHATYEVIGAGVVPPSEGC